MPRPKKSRNVEAETPAEPPKELRVLSIQVRHVLGIEERALEPDGRTVLVTGRNATGKSSLLKAVQAGLAGGSLGRLARVGSEEEPEVVIVLGGDGQEYRVEKRGGKTAEVWRREGESQAFVPQDRPQEFLDQLFDSRLASPVAWLLAKPKDQQALFLEALPLEMDWEGLKKAIGDAAPHVEDMRVPLDIHALEHVALVRDAIYRARTGVNGDARGKRVSAEQIRRQLPAEGPEGPGASIEQIERNVQLLAAEIGQEEEAAAAAEREAVQIAQAHRNEAAAEARREYEEKLNRADMALVEAKAVAAEARGRATALLGERRGELQLAREELSALRAQADDVVRFRALEKQAAAFEEEAEKHQKEADRLTAAIERLDVFRTTLARNLPIPGVTFEDGQIKVDGVPLEQVNTSKQVIVAARVAAERAKRNPLKLLFLDGLQELDSAHREALLGLLAKKGIQTFGAVVSDGQPGVEYVGAVTG